MFSIIIPLYNKEQSITNTLKSVLKQTFTDFEIIIVNDGSTDKSVAKVDAFKDGRIRLIHQENEGVSSARNKGIKKAKYEWIAFLDADDIWLENHLSCLKEMITTFKNHKAFCTSYTKLDGFLRCEDFSLDTIKIVEDYFEEVIKYHFFWTGVVCIHKSVFQEVGYFNTQLSRGEDLELWMRIGRVYSIIWSNCLTAIYKQDSENKVTHKKVNLNESITYYLNFKNISDRERQYLSQLLRNNAKEFIKTLDIKNIFKLFLRYNFKINWFDLFYRMI